MSSIIDFVNKTKDAWPTTKVFSHWNFDSQGTQKEGDELRFLGNGGLCVKSDYLWHSFSGGIGGGPVEAWYFAKTGKAMPQSEFMATVYEMADAAGIARPVNTPEEKARHEERRTLEEIFCMVADFYHSQLPEDQREHLRNRYGFTDATIDSLKLGYAPADGDALFKHLHHTKKVALADVTKTGLFRRHNSQWTDALQGRLIFPYWNRGSVVYFSGRETANTPQWEKDRGMKYSKQLVHSADNQHVSKEVCNSYFYGEDEIRGAKEVFISEGVTDCIIANQFGFPSVSPTTVTFRDSDRQKLVTLLKSTERIYIVNDNEENKAGAKGALSTAAALWKAGKVARFVELPRPEGVSKVDLNDFLRTHTADEFRALLPTAKTLLDLLIDELESAEPGEAKASALREVFELIAQNSDGYMLTQWRKDLPKKLGVSKAEYDEFLENAVKGYKATKVSELQAKQNTAGTSASRDDRYVVDGGRICKRNVKINEETEEEEVSYEALCNFSARIVADALRDDGSSDLDLRMVIEGKMENGDPLPRILIKSSEFEQMKWVNEKWGARPAIEPGRSSRDELRRAIQFLSEKEGIGEERIYTHTGWRVTNDKRIFLHAGGAIGMDGVSVELPEGLNLYEFPTDNAVDAKQAMIESLKLMDIAPARVTYPIWAMMYTAPLTEIIEPAFLGWIQGFSGALKTSLTTMFLTHFGRRFDDRHVPIDWISTENSIEAMAYWAKDVPLLVDDFRPPNAPKEADALKVKAGRIATISGNRSGRGRMDNKSETGLRKTYIPRGLVLATAERELDGYSVNGRMLTVGIEKGDVDPAKLGNGQVQPHVYGYAMKAYIEMLSKEWDTLAKALPPYQTEYRNKFSSEGHRRIPDAVATLYVGFELAMKFAVSLGAQTEAEAQERCKTFYDVLVEIAEEQSANTEIQSPALRFMQTVILQLHQQKMFIKGQNDCADLGGGDTVGWHDGHDVYITGAAYNLVCTYLYREGSLAPGSEKAIRNEMVKLGWISKTTKGSNTLVVRSRLTEKMDRVIAISFDKFSEIVNEMGMILDQLYVPTANMGQTKPEGTIDRVHLGSINGDDYGKVEHYVNGKQLDLTGGNGLTKVVGITPFDVHIDELQELIKQRKNGSTTSPLLIPHVENGSSTNGGYKYND